MQANERTGEKPLVIAAGGRDAIPKELQTAAVTCALCGADDSTLVDEPRGFRMVECRKCGLVYLNPRPTDEWLERLYQSYLPDEPDGVAQWNRMMDGLYRTARRCLIGRFPTGGRLLDVGCAHGQFLEIMGAAGWHVEGLEICGQAAAACRRKELAVRSESLAAAELPRFHYDAVTLFYVLEHLRDPLGGLRKLHAALKPGGVCLVRVPHTTPLVKWLARIGRRTELFDPPYHLFDFSPRVLTRLLREAGFHNVRIEIDAATRPLRRGPRIVSIAASAVGRALQAISGGRLLLPGVSKTAVAEKSE